MLENLNRELKIVLILVIAILLGYINNIYNKGTPKNIVLGFIVLASLYCLYTILELESFTNTVPSPINDDDSVCYSEGEEIPCNELNSNSEQMNYNPNVNNHESNQNVSGSYGIDQDETYKEVNSNVDSNQLPNECYPKDILSPKELLPKDTESTWAQSVPAGQGSLGDQNFLNAGFHIGVNTVGQTLRNPNYGLRSEPPNPQVKVSPWMQTTIEPDSNRRPMEII